MIETEKTFAENLYKIIEKNEKLRQQFIAVREELAKYTDLEKEDSSGGLTEINNKQQEEDAETKKNASYTCEACKEDFQTLNKFYTHNQKIHYSKESFSNFRKSAKKYKLKFAN